MAPTSLFRNNSILPPQYYVSQYRWYQARPFLCLFPGSSLGLKNPYFITNSNVLLLQTPTHSSHLSSNVVFCRPLLLCLFFISYLHVLSHKSFTVNVCVSPYLWGTNLFEGQKITFFVSMVPRAVSGIQ